MSSVLLLLATASLLVLGRGHVCEEGEIRLAGALHNSSGRVEFCHGNKWGTVCDDGWGSNETQVVCRQLGLLTNGTVYFTFGGGSGKIFLDDVKCSGLEERLDQCNHSGIGVENCKHEEDIGVICAELQSGDGRRCGYEESPSELTREELQKYGNRE